MAAHPPTSHRKPDRTPSDKPVAPESRQPPLEAVVADFVRELENRFAARAKRRPRALKARVLGLIALYLPPHPRRPGRKPQGRITQAAKLYRQQLVEVEAGTRKTVNWVTIARECIRGYGEIRSGYRRTAETDRLRNAVYARLKRCETKPARNRKPAGTH